jgi:hypothetical protein
MGRGDSTGAMQSDLREHRDLQKVHNADMLKLNLEINLSALHKRDETIHGQMSSGADETTEELFHHLQFQPKRKSIVLPDHRYSKKLEPVYIFRDQLDLGKETSKRHNDVVWRTFGKRSLSHVANDQIQINNRIHELVEPNRVPGAPNFPRKLKVFHNEMRKGFYEHVSPQITSRGTTGRELGSGPASNR